MTGARMEAERDQLITSWRAALDERGVTEDVGENEVEATADSIRELEPGAAIALLRHALTRLARITR